MQNLPRKIKKSLNASPLVLLGCLALYSSSGSAAGIDGRFTLRGLTGTNGFGDVDALIPLSRSCNSL